MAEADLRGESEPLAPRGEDDIKLEEQETEETIYREVVEIRSSEPLRAALLYVSLWQVQHKRARVLHMPKGSLYTAAVVMPMIARSSGYCKSMTASALKQVTLAMMCILLQVSVLDSLYFARVQLPGVYGVPAMCTYGQDPGGHRRPHGPTGQRYEATYGNVETDYTMVMVRNSLYEVLKKVGVEVPGIGPVEFGMESTTCRFVCVLVFCVSICEEIFHMEGQWRFIFNTPTVPWKRESQDEADRKTAWIMFDKGVLFDKESRTERAKELWKLIGKSSMDHIKFQCGGMPMVWKVPSGILLAVRFIVILVTFWNGMFFLMNTGSIMDLILNSLALTFIIQLDSIMFTSLSRGVSRDVMQRLEPVHLKAHRNALREELERRRSKDIKWSCCTFLMELVQFNLSTLIVAAVTILGHYVYFLRHCEMDIMPLDIRELGGSSYFEGQTRIFGGWQFIFGSWYSKPTYDTYTGEVSCDPAQINSLTGEVIHAVKGCGMSDTWPP